MPAFDRLFSLFKPNPHAYWRAFGEFLEGNESTAMTIIDGAVEAGKAEGHHFHLRGMILRRQGNIDGAIEAFEKAVTMEDTLLDSYLRMAECFQTKNVPWRAIEMLKKLLERVPNFPPALDRLGFLYLEQQAIGAARETFEVLSKVTPQNGEVLYNLAVTEQLCGNEAKAREIQARLNDIDSNRADQLSKVLHADGERRRSAGLTSGRTIITDHASSSSS